MAENDFGPEHEPSPDEVKAGITQRLMDIIRANDDVLAAQLLAALHNPAPAPEEENAMLADAEDEPDALDEAQEEEISRSARRSQQIDAFNSMREMFARHRAEVSERIEAARKRRLTL
jgi:hypothetical protein